MCLIKSLAMKLKWSGGKAKIHFISVQYGVANSRPQPQIFPFREVPEFLLKILSVSSAVPSGLVTYINNQT